MSNKGSPFEREICKTLSKWWTEGERDDVFWRSQASGGRATIRKKKGATLQGQEGDVCSTDPISAPLTDLFTIELKRGYGSWSPMDMMEKPSNKNHIFMDFIVQASRQSKNGTDWILIYKKDRCDAIVCMEYNKFQTLTGFGFDRNMDTVTFRIGSLKVVLFPLKQFLQVDPKSILCFHGYMKQLRENLCLSSLKT
jgi:hypothetical protein